MVKRSRPARDESEMRAVDDAAVDVAAEAVGAEPERRPSRRRRASHVPTKPGSLFRWVGSSNVGVDRAEPGRVSAMKTSTSEDETGNDDRRFPNQHRGMRRRAMRMSGWRGLVNSGSSDRAACREMSMIRLIIT